MVYALPNLPDTSYIDQAEPDAGDFAALAERNTGVISGCAVTAQGTPALAVDVAAGFVIVGGAPVTVAAGSLAVIGGEAQPRFDLVVVAANATKSIIKGTASTNPRFPTFDPSVYCFLSAVYVRQSVSSIVATDIVAKGMTSPAAFRRVYADDVTEFVSTTNSATTKSFKVMSSGEHRWMSSILKRTADSAMEWATSLVVKAADNALAVLILKARSGTALEIATQHLLEVQSNGGSALAYLNGAGQLYADNFKTGSGSPEGSVLGNKGDMYVNRAFSTANAAIYLKTTDGTNTGWQAMGKYDPTATALAPLSVYAWLGNPATPPAGSAYLNGSFFSVADANYANVFAVIQYTYGGTVGVNAALPDWRNVSPMGAGSIVALGAKAGGVSVTQTAAMMPQHDHDIIDNGHFHPVPGFEYLWKPPSEPTWIRPWPADQKMNGLTIPSVPYMDITPEFFDRKATTGITVADAGGSTPTPTLSPVVGTHWLVKL